MTIASSIILFPGTEVAAAPAGKHRLYLRTDGTLMKMDDQGVAIIVGREGTQNPSLNEITDVNATGDVGDVLTKLPDGSFKIEPLPAFPTPPTHQLNDLTDVNAAGGAEGFVLTQKADDSFEMKAPGDQPSTVHPMFHAVNDVSQSHVSNAIVEIEWNTMVRNLGAKFIHSTTVSPEEIEIDFTGWLEIHYKIVMLNSWEKDWMLRATIFINGAAKPVTRGYGFSKDDNHGTILCAQAAGLYLPVAQGDILVIKTDITRNTTFGETNSIATISGESTITLKADEA